MGLLDILKKRSDDKQMSHADYVSKAVTAEASGDTRSIDVTKLELAMAAIGMDFSMFEKAVERERRLTELRGVASGLADAQVRFKDLAQHAKDRQAAAEAEITAIRKEVEQAEQAAGQARSELTRCQMAESELKKLLESPARRQARLEAKPALSKLRRRKSDLEQEVVDLESAIKNVDVRTFTFSGERDQYIASRQLKRDQAQKKLAEITQRLAQAEIEAGENQAEPETAAAAG